MIQAEQKTFTERAHERVARIQGCYKRPVLRITMARIDVEHLEYIAELGVYEADIQAAIGVYQEFQRKEREHGNQD